jgi:energy-coupling factor transport system permease protein
MPARDGYRSRTSGVALHPVTWVAWTAAAAGVALSTRNPMYLSLLLGIAAVQYASLGRHDADARGWGSLLRIAVGLAVLIVPFNALNVHIGSRVLFRLPDNWPLIGGPITLEAIAWGACSALSLTTLLVLLATFNLQISHAQLLRLTPAFVYEAGLIVSIALTFIPQMMISAREIREAQLIRGFKMRRLRDGLPFLMALLTTGLERSLQLAESMEARGFGRARTAPVGAASVPPLQESPLHEPPYEPPLRDEGHKDMLYKGLTILGLGGVLCAFFVLTYFRSLRAAGWAGVALSTALLLGVFWAQGKRVSRTSYRRERWTWRDGVVLGVAFVVVLAVVLARAQDAGALVYDPYDRLLPRFDPWLGAALAMLVAPALVPSDRPPRFTDQTSVRPSRRSTWIDHD